MTGPLEVLYEDNHLLAVMKQSGVLTMGDETGDTTMVDLARDYLKVKYNKPGNVFVGVVHRLDRPVSGVLLFARTSKAASRLSDQFRRGVVRKEYRAILDGIPTADSGELVDWLVKDRNNNIVSSVSKSTPGAKHSVLTYQVLDKRSGSSLVNIQPQTGRSHQIRVQFATRQCPIEGDAKYGSTKPGGGSILLHAQRLSLEHPTKKEPIEFSCEAPFAL